MNNREIIDSGGNVLGKVEPKDTQEVCVQDARKQQEDAVSGLTVPREEQQWPSPSVTMPRRSHFG